MLATSLGGAPQIVGIIYGAFNQLEYHFTDVPSPADVRGSIVTIYNTKMYTSNNVNRKNSFELNHCTPCSLFYTNFDYICKCSCLLVVKSKQQLTRLIA